MKECKVIRTCFMPAVLACLILSIPVYSDEVVGWRDWKPPGQPLKQIAKIAAGDRHSLALKSDGSIVGWGYDSYGQATPPAGNDYTDIAVGSDRSLALKSDGSIVEWGKSTAPPSGTDFIAIATRRGHSLALKSDGSIVGWGGDRYGQATPSAGKGFIDIAVGYHPALR